MARTIFAACLCLLLVPAALAAGPDDAATPVYKFINAFNTGDMNTAFALCSAGEVTIVDEFPPFQWVGSKAARHWAADYDRHAGATGVTEGRVTYTKATRVELKGDLAYVIIPTVYLYREHGTAMQEEGHLTAVMHAEAGGWKIRSWTWSGVTPHPAR
ncbi:MAG TPA: nuclear transport factor 2 family protein [Terracidiphilus sp.]|nr:nuclear transport factor 2 family protein [Terracidiphilus sp.]